MTRMPASAASRIASAANGGGTKIIVASAPVSSTASCTVLKTGRPMCSRAALAGRHAADELGAVVERLLGMERALLAGEALRDDFRVLVDDVRITLDAWDSSLRLGAWRLATAFCAASLRSSAGVIARPEFASSSRPFSTLVPCRRTTTGIFRPDFLHRGDDAFGDHVAAHDAAEDVDQDRLAPCRKTGSA